MEPVIINDRQDRSHGRRRNLDFFVVVVVAELFLDVAVADVGALLAREHVLTHAPRLSTVPKKTGS
jgi:hypothetical protein